MARESTLLLRVSMSVHSTRGQDERGHNTMENYLPQLRISISRRRERAVGNPDSRDNGRTQVKCNIHLPVEVKDHASVFQD